MAELQGYCGYRCDLCPAYKANLRTREDRERVSRDWKRYFSSKVALEEIGCEGCLKASDTPNKECLVKPCAIDRGVKSCAECNDFVCEKLRARLDAIKPIAERHAQGMPAGDYDRYIRPYEAEERLLKLNRKLRANNKR